ncbi:DUF4386 domain-containing protein [Iodobacter sp. HSC-16F04]|uniref:DUF4386 domain-containing protein n=1 Tax=Iodobacter violaceini TaxID=3044271 RepID=A0ABX0KV70_9NEIS|nr:DUF4386 domain-containing protein [Iodobacter violacea]NHQ87699.1 DUF4386 domain-containing protein [Iodobacter violacea]
MHSTSSRAMSVGQRVRLARIAGAMYLATIAFALFGEAYVRSSLLDGSSAARSAANLIASNSLYRIGLATDLLTFVGVAVLVWALFLLLREIDSHLAVLALIFRTIELGVHFSAIAFGMVGMSLLGGGEYTGGLTQSQLHSMVGMVLHGQMAGLGIGFIPLGLGSAVFAFLLFRSGYVPKILAAWGILASVLLASYSFGVVLSPNTSDYFVAGMLPMFIYEVSLGFWLLFYRGAARLQSTA